MIPRRRMLGGFVASAAGFSLSRLSVAAALAPTAAQTTGPFYPLALPRDSDNDLIHVAGRDGVAKGTVTYISGRVLDHPAGALSRPNSAHPFRGFRPRLPAPRDPDVRRRRAPKRAGRRADERARSGRSRPIDRPVAARGGDRAGCSSRHLRSRPRLTPREAAMRRSPLALSRTALASCSMRHFRQRRDVE